MFLRLSSRSLSKGRAFHFLLLLKGSKAVGPLARGSIAPTRSNKLTEAHPPSFRIQTRSRHLPSRLKVGPIPPMLHPHPSIMNLLRLDVNATMVLHLTQFADRVAMAFQLLLRALAPLALLQSGLPAPQGGLQGRLSTPKGDLQVLIASRRTYRTSFSPALGILTLPLDPSIFALRLVSVQRLGFSETIAPLPTVWTRKVSKRYQF